MLEAAEVRPGDRVLEVGTGSGYAAAIASRPERSIRSSATPASPPWRGDGWPTAAMTMSRSIPATARGGFPGTSRIGNEPYDAILVAAGGPQVPDALKQQLAIGGRLVIPVGASGEPQALLKVTRTGANL